MGVKPQIVPLAISEVELGLSVAKSLTYFDCEFSCVWMIFIPFLI